MPSAACPEGLFTHLIMVPFDLTDEWTVKSVREKGVYNVRDTMAVLENEKGEQRELTMVFSWPVKQPSAAMRSVCGPMKRL